MARGRVEGIWIKRARLGPMDAAETAYGVADQGLIGNANQGGKRQVTLIERESWDAACRELGSALDPRLRRANLMLSGLPLAGSRGRFLRIGDLRLQIWGETRPCERMDEACPGLRKALDPSWRGGAFGSILEDGSVSIGDVAEWED